MTKALALIFFILMAADAHHDEVAARAAAPDPLPLPRTLGLAATTPAWAHKMLQQQAVKARVDAVVAHDGTGDFTNIGTAIAAAPRKSMARYIIRVRKGIYDEILRISDSTWNITLIGDGIGVTVITGNRSTNDHYPMPETATLGVLGPGFLAQDLTIQNTAGPEKNQSIALRLRSSLSVVYRCSLEGYQDTLYAEFGTQFYRDCKITGTVDFIYGDATAVFQHCQLLARLPRPGQQNVVTAQGRHEANSTTGFVFQFCNITGDPLLRAKAVETYLGRPWKNYSRVVFMESRIDEVVHPLGYLPWNGSAGLDTLFYAEYKNTGPGSAVNGRVKWPGFHLIRAAEAGEFTAAKFLNGEGWLPGTGVEFTPGL